MKLYLDADGCPVVRQALAIAARRGVRAVVVCDTAHRIDCPGAELVVVDQGPDSADLALANRLRPGDVAVTQDFGLAALCLARGGPRAGSERAPVHPRQHRPAAGAAGLCRQAEACGPALQGARQAHPGAGRGVLRGAGGAAGAAGLRF